jgi:hypothetical protein
VAISFSKKKIGLVDLIEVLDLVSVPVGEDTLGQLTDARPKIKSGPLISGTILNTLLDYHQSSRRSNEKYTELNSTNRTSAKILNSKPAVKSIMTTEKRIVI